MKNQLFNRSLLTVAVVAAMGMTMTATVIGSNGTIVSDIFNLSKATTSSPTQATLYFNSKYGATNDAP